MTLDELRCALEADTSPIPKARALELVEHLRSLLNTGEVRAAQPMGDGSWAVNAWVKRGILLGFRHSSIQRYPDAGAAQFFDKGVWPTRDLQSVDGLRVVPGGSSVRDGSYIGTGVTIMPPAYINVGAWVGDGTMIDSHALVGSCAQIGARVHLSAAAQIGGVLEPIGACPVVIEDDVLVGGGVGVYEGTQVGKGAVLAAGLVLTRSTPVFDAVHELVIRSDESGVLRIPPGAVVVPGARPLKGAFAKTHGLQLASPIIVKYRDSGTDAATALEDALR